MASPYVLPDRRTFADFIVRIFKKYKDKSLDKESEEEDLCRKQSGTTNSRELLDHQKIVRDYLLQETPYRGLLLYHGLGSGKTCSSIAVAESLLSTKKVYVLLPASLESNYKSQIKICGDPIYKFDNYWEPKSIRSPEDRQLGKALGISDAFLDQNGRFYVTVPNKTPNFLNLSLDDRNKISSQIDDVLNQRFHFIRYNGITKDNIDRILYAENMFDDSVVIIDEVHDLISSVVSEREIKEKLYKMIYNSKNSKVVCLSGTPMVNSPNEIAFLMNLVKGPITRITITTKQAVSWDEGMMNSFFRNLKDVDTIEYDSVKRIILLTRNPPFFESVFNEKGERIAVQYNKTFKQLPDIREWVSTWKSKFESQFPGTELADAEKYVVEDLECLPTDYETFMKTYIDGLNVKNPIMFSRRIQGLVSYFRTADERLLPKEIEKDKTLVKVPMSSEQFVNYLDTRFKEIQREKSRALRKNLDSSMSSYRVGSRMICNYSVPRELKTIQGDSEETIVPNPEILAKMKQTPERYFSIAALKVFSPKMLAMLQDIKENIGTFNSQFIYSFYESLEGLGIFSAVLDYNGFQRYKLIKDAGVWKEDPTMKSGVPAYGMYTGQESMEERELYRQIFNNDYESGFPQTLKDSIRERRLCILMGTKAAAVGINLKDVRNVYIMESYWNPALISQAIGRAIRICSHARLPIPERTVKVKIYITTFSPEQEKAAPDQAPNIVPIRRADTTLKRYEGFEPRETFMTSDEYLWEISYEKDRIIKNVSHLLKQAAIDCEIHRKLHSKEVPVIQCMRFDTTTTAEDLAYNPSFKNDIRDELYMRNIIRKKRRLQKIRVKGVLLVLDPDTNEIFDFMSFEDSKRLIRLGIRSSPTEIRFFTV